MDRNAYYDIALAEVIAVTRDAVALVLDVPPELSETFSYRAGQFLTLRLPVPHGLETRCYSLASAPGIDKRLTIVVKQVNGGLVSTAVCQSLKPGDVISVMPPAGCFTPKSFDTDLVLMAGGSGIAPILSILKAVLAHGPGRIFLLYANRNEESVIFAGEIAKLAGDHPARLTVVHWLESVQRMPDPAQLATLVKRPAVEADAYVCGPEPFMNCCVTALARAGMANDRVHLESFGAPLGQAPEALGSSSVAATLSVRIDGEIHEVAWPAGTRMLDAMLAAGLDAPFSCRVGSCSTCMCRLTRGQAVMALNQALSEEELAQGWVLSCQAQAVSTSIAVEVPS